MVHKETGSTNTVRKTLRIPWQKSLSKGRRKIIVPKSAIPNTIRPIRADARARLITAIARGRFWLNELATGAVTNIEAIAARELSFPKTPSGLDSHRKAESSHPSG